ncbi:MAG TPA: Ig-like domain-containing protein, partial [Pilimelia sp.]|nr:Ig-like domain-containing protein [Pilimelia sp.]
MRTISRLLASALAGALAAGGLGAPALAASPTVTAVTPTHNARDVAPDARPTATFSEPVAAGSLRYSFVRTSGAVDVSGHYRYDAAARTFTFTPRAPLAAGTRYTLTVKVRGADGAMSRPYSWAFTTRAADTAPPGAPGAPTVGEVTSD